MDFNAVYAFVLVAEELSFSKAAQRSGIPKSFLSRKVAELEESLGARLLQRTTREVRLTDSGKQYFESTRTCINQLDEAAESVRSSNVAPRGHLRVTMPAEIGSIFTRYIAEKFLARNPAITIEVLATNQVLDLVRDNIDLAIRPSRVADPSTIAIKLGVLKWGLFASPDWYRENRTSIKSPKDLSEVELLGFNPTLQPNLDWKMRLSHSDSKEVVSFRFEPRFVASSFSVLIEGLLSGLGAAALPGFMVQEHVREKKLVSVLPKWMIREEELLAVYLQKKFMPARLRALIDHLKENPVLR